MNIAEAIVKVVGDFSGFRDELSREAGTAGDAAGATLGGRLRGALNSPAVTRGMTAAGGAIGTFVASGVEMFGGFEQRMNEVYTLLPGMSEQAMSQMSDDVLQLARDTGRMPDEVVPALYQALSAGVPPDNVFDFLRTSNEAAIGGVTDLETAVDGISSVVNAYGSDVLDAATASDLMFTAVKGGKTTYDELASSLFNVVPTASAIGVEFGNLTAALATMTAQGTPTKVATTQLRQLLVELSKDGSKASEAFKEIAGVGMQEFIAQGGNMEGALAIMQQAADENGVALQDMFGSVEAGAAALQLTGKGAEKFSQELENAGESAGATGVAFDQMDQGIAASGRKIAAHVATLAIGVGEKFAGIGPLLMAMNQGGKLFGVSPARLFGGLGGAITGRVIPMILSGFVGLAGPIATVGATIGTVFTTAMSAVIAAWPLVLIALIVGAIILLATNPELREKALEIGGAILGAIGDALGAIGEVLGQIIGAVVTWGGQVLGAVGDAMSGVVSTILGVPGRIASWVGSIVGQAASWVGQVVGKVAAGIGQVVGFVLSIPGRVVSWVGSLIGQAAQLVAGIVGNIVRGVGIVVSTVLSIPGRVIGWVGSLIGGAARAAGGFISSIVGMAGDVIRTIIGIPGRVVGSLVGGFANAGKRVVDTFLGFIRAIPEAVGNILGGVGDFIGGLIPSFDVGTDYVPRDMLAMVHKGEMIVPAAEAAAIRGGRRELAPPPAQAGGGAGLTVIVHNPKPEPASTSVRRELQKRMVLGTV